MGRSTRSSRRTALEQINLDLALLGRRLIRVPDHARRQPRAVGLLAQDDEAATSNGHRLGRPLGRKRDGERHHLISEIAPPVDLAGGCVERDGLASRRHVRLDRRPAAHVCGVRRHPDGVRRVNRAYASPISGKNCLLVLLLGPLDRRSEEHTSELQSQSNLVCRLLLEKKKKNQDECYCTKNVYGTHYRTVYHN